MAITIITSKGLKKRLKENIRFMKPEMDGTELGILDSDNGNFYFESGGEKYPVETGDVVGIKRKGKYGTFLWYNVSL